MKNIFDLNVSQFSAYFFFIQILKDFHTYFAIKIKFFLKFCIKFVINVHLFDIYKYYWIFISKYDAQK